MRYSNNEILIIEKLYQHVIIEEIQKTLIDAGFRKRTFQSIQKKVDEFIEKDKLRQKRIDTMNKRPHHYICKQLLNSAKRRALEKNLEFNLTYEWLISKLEVGLCERTQMKFIILFGHGKHNNPFAPSLDRVDNSKGYTIDNTEVVLINYNKFKCTTSNEIVKEIAKSIVKETL